MKKLLETTTLHLRLKKTLEFLDRLIDENDLQFIQHSKRVH